MLLPCLVLAYAQFDAPWSSSNPYMLERGKGFYTIVYVLSLQCKVKGAVKFLFSTIKHYFNLYLSILEFRNSDFSMCQFEILHPIFLLQNLSKFPLLKQVFFVYTVCNKCCFYSLRHQLIRVPTSSFLLLIYRPRYSAK